MPVIVIANTKGGVGKSTLTIHLTAGLQAQGRRLNLVDLDQGQHTAARFFEARTRTLNGSAVGAVEAHALRTGISRPFAERAHELQARLQRVVDEARHTGDTVLIDLPAGDSPALAAALRLADVVLTPINDSLLDLATIEDGDGEVGALGRAVREARQARKARDQGDFAWALVLNRLSPLASRNRAKVEERIAELAAPWRFTVAGRLTERTIYRELFENGLTLVDLFAAEGKEDAPTGSSLAAQRELRALFDNLGLPQTGPLEGPAPIAAE